MTSARRLCPIVQVAVVPQAIVVNQSVPAKSLQEVIALAKKEGDKMNFGSPGLGSAPHMTMEMFMHSAGIKIQQVHYRGTARGLTDVLAGRLTGTVIDTLNAKSYYDTKQIRILCVTTSHLSLS
jgi:tripartite-type tricarboxylate transporter receptor subunit TctC